MSNSPEYQQGAYDNIIAFIIEIGKINAKLESADLDLKINFIYLPMDYQHFCADTKIKRALENNHIKVGFHNEPHASYFIQSKKESKILSR